ncbi:hypothetical protein QAD02_003445 [Eretmocerus hayati]|uniref:Uncharacterized protein n=1 Tax=Eretmocerus hayati TaxID=131215 RepID=A0ACC2NM37_9HYME|nr:hypothetical protein QAD02_003445 [Eretmocerus hayati]
MPRIRHQHCSALATRNCTSFLQFRNSLAEFRDHVSPPGCDRCRDVDVEHLDKAPPPQSRQSAPDINDLLPETFCNRQNWILKDSLPVIAVLKNWFKKLLNLEQTGRMFEGKTNAFIAEFPSFFEKRLIYSAKFYNPKLFQKYRHEKNALLVLIRLIPQPASVVLSRSKKTASEGQIKSKKVPKLYVKKTQMKTYQRGRINVKREYSNNKQAAPHACISFDYVSLGTYQPLHNIFCIII